MCRIPLNPMDIGSELEYPSSGRQWRLRHRSNAWAADYFQFGFGAEIGTDRCHSAIRTFDCRLNGMKRSTAVSLARNPRELFLVGRIFLFLVFLPLPLRFLKIQHLVSAIMPHRSPPPHRRFHPERIVYLCERAATRLERFGYRNTCLKRCLVMFHFLRTEGVPVDISFGAFREGGALKGHSWLTLDGRLFHEAQEKVDRFVYFFSLPPARSAEQQDGTTETRDDHDIEGACFD